MHRTPRRASGVRSLAGAEYGASLECVVLLAVDEPKGLLTSGRWRGCAPCEPRALRRYLSRAVEDV